MFTNENGISLSDIAAVTNNDGFNGNNGWWILVILLALFGGMGGYGWNNGWNGGWNNGRFNNVNDGYVLASDFANIERKIDGVNNGLCDGFYAQNTNLLNGFAGVNANLSNGFAGVNANIANGFAGVNNAVCTLGYQNADLINRLDNTVQAGNNATQMAMMQGFNGVQAGQTALATQLQQCCCENKQQIAQLRYDMAMQAQQIMQNDNANYRALHDENVAAQMAAKDARIGEMAAQIERLNLAASQQAQNAYLVNMLHPCPVPAYNVPNPYCPCNS